MLVNHSSTQLEVTSCSKPVPDKVWFAVVLNVLLALVILFFAEVSSLQADGLFDFQMKLAKKGNPEAEFKVGEMYETGFGVKKNQAEAEIWIKKAAAHGHDTAGYKLLYWDMRKNGMKGGNRAKYNHLVTKAEAGDGQAMYYVGKMYGNGVGVTRNYDKALDWLNKATFIGILEAEREAVAIREEKQRALANKRRNDEKRKAAAATAAATAAAAAKVTQSKQEQNNQAADKAASDKKKSEKAANASASQQRAEQQRQQQLAAAEEKERKRQALLKQKAKEKKESKTEFEADPCKGKSARFLSTCR